MRIDTSTRCIFCAEFIESPDYDERPDGSSVELLVIHNISLTPNEFGGGYMRDLFLNKLDLTVNQ